MKLPKLPLTLLSSALFPLLLNAQSPCNRPTAKKDLDINMVRATMLSGGDMWWDRLSNAKYEIPKGSKRVPIFVGSIWLGGLDALGNLKVAAQTYHQAGDDFWAGPLDSTGNPQCITFDRIWSIKRSDVDDFRSGAAPTNDIKEWPGINPGLRNNSPGFKQLAPFHDANGDNKYNTADGDYPFFAGKGNPDCSEALHGDQALWWVINDVGNVHTETGGEALGVEIHITAYAFHRPGNILDSTTFYRFKIINKGSEAIRNTYFSINTDTDLGNPADDYVGCDVNRGLGYVYNGDNTDENGQALGYSPLAPNQPPPTVGIDILRGPKADTLDGIDNDLDGFIDEPGNEYARLSGFIYFDNDQSVTGFPKVAVDYYNYMRCMFKDGKHMVHGGNGYPGSTGSTATTVSHIFPADSDPNGLSAGGVSGLPYWTEAATGNVAGDRRMLCNSGSFTLDPGGSTIVHAAVLFGWASSGDVNSSIKTLQRASDRVQAFFDACFSPVYSSLNSPKPPSSLQIIPNPAAEQLVIQNTGVAGVLSLFNTQGQLIFTQKIKHNKQELDVSKLPRGLLFYTFSSSTGQKTTGKIILK